MSLVLCSHDHPGRGRQGTNWRRRCLSGLGDPSRWHLGNHGQRVSRARWGPCGSALALELEQQETHGGSSRATPSQLRALPTHCFVGLGAAVPVTGIEFAEPSAQENSAPCSKIKNLKIASGELQAEGTRRQWREGLGEGGAGPARQEQSR